MEKELEFERLENLREEVKKHQVLYESGTPEITDTEYDELYKELMNLSVELGVEDEESPLTEINGQIDSSLKKVKHSTLVGSLAKANTAKDILKFAKELAEATGKESNMVSIEHKFDGLTIVIEYLGGHLFRASTRGNGEIGEDVTENVKTIKNLPQKILDKHYVKIRVEVMLPESDFNRINVEGNYSNARNLVSGTLRQLDVEIAKSRNLIAYAFDIMEMRERNSDSNIVKLIRNEKEKVDWFIYNGFTINPFESFELSEKTANDLFDYCTNFDASSRSTLEYGIDGMVFKAFDWSIHEKMGYRHKNPRWALAFKFKSKNATTTLEKVIWDIGRTGKVSPVGIFAQVKIDNVSITKATLHNPDYIRARNLHIGDKIVVARNNDVIPAIIANVKVLGTVPCEIPTVCPECGSTLVLDGSNLFCLNDNCGRKKMKQIVSWVAKDRMNIVGLGEKSIAQFIEAGLLKEVIDIYKLPERWEEIVELPKWDIPSAASLIENIVASKNVSFDKFLYALGMPGVGASTAKALATHYDNLEQILQLTQLDVNVAIADLCSIEDIGTTIANDILNFLTTNMETIIALQKELKIEYYHNRSAVVTTTGSIVGLNFVITGTLSEVRANVEGRIINNGGFVGNSVSSKTDYLVIGANPGSKFAKAKKLGTPIITETQLGLLILGKPLS